MLIAYIDDFLKEKETPLVIVIDNAPTHTSNMFINKQLEWEKSGFEVFNLPAYSPKLNLIEHLWRFMKYEWIEFNAYDCWDNLVNYVEKIAVNFGTEYTINFV
jgi:transposase